MSTQAWISVCGLAAAPLFAALGWILARRKVPKGCVTWRRVEGFAPEHGARGYETYVDVALPPGDIGREDLVVEIRAVGLTNEDVVAARRSPHPEETASCASSRAARIVARSPGSVRIELPDRPWTGARVAFHTAQPLGDVAVEARRGTTRTQAVPTPNVENVSWGFGLAVLAFNLVVSITRPDSPRAQPTVEIVLNGVWCVLLAAAAAGAAHQGTLRWRSSQPLLWTSFGRQPAAGPPSSPAPPARPTVAEVEVDRHRPAANAAAT